MQAATGLLLAEGDKLYRAPRHYVNYVKLVEPGKDSSIF